MFPGIYDFAWDAGHIIFLGIFYMVLMVVFSTIVIATIRALRDFREQRGESLRWHAQFEELPDQWRRCRHELSGEIDSRRCENGFDCRECLEHPKFVAARATRPMTEIRDHRVAGFEVPADRLYHRGHTWVREEEGLMTVGLDDLARRLMGKPDEIRLPKAGSRLVANGTGWFAEKDGVRVRVLSPIDGEVVETGGPERGWYLKLKPFEDQRPDTRHLLTVTEAKQWMLREAERLQMVLAPPAVGVALADGGLPLEDLASAIPPDQRDEVYGMVFLNG